MLGLAYHSQNRDASPSLVSFASQKIPSNTPIETTTAKPAFTYTNGPFSLQWTADVNSVDFTFSTSVTDSDNIWAAFAFSSDKTMVCLKYLN